MVNELSGHCAPLKVPAASEMRGSPPSVRFCDPGRFSEFSRLDIFREGSALM
jgi:hypothetical protein